MRRVSLQMEIKDRVVDVRHVVKPLSIKHRTGEVNQQESCQNKLPNLNTVYVVMMYLKTKCTSRCLRSCVMVLVKYSVCSNMFP